MAREGSSADRTGDRLDGDVAIVTGGGSGIGAATCRELAARGADVVVADVDADGGERVADEITDAAGGDHGGGTSGGGNPGGEAVFAEVDVSDEDAVADGVATARDQFGGLDVLVNNAAVASREHDGPVTEFDDDAFEFIAGVNLRGPLYACKHAIPAMQESDDGTGAIVNNASIAALVAERGMDSYTATKGALVSVTRSIAVEYAPEIRANTIAPGVVETPMLEEAMADDPDSDVPENLARMVEETPLGMADPRKIASAIAFLASDDAGFVTGATVPVDGGFTAK